MKTSISIRLSVFLLALSLSLPSFAWDRAGHMASGAIAYHFLKQYSPSAIIKFVKILKAHPQFASRWQSKYDSLPDMQKDLFLFMAAARWPDDVKGTSYDHPDWHYYAIPVTFLPADTQPPKQDNSIVQFANNLNIVKSQSANQGNKAIALCWVFHLMGDFHQPLHDVNLFSAAFPVGDREGNDFLIKDLANDLHHYWDDVFLPDAKVNYKSATWFSTVDDAAKNAKTKNGGVVFNSTTVIDTKAIANEAIALAKSSVYKFKGKLLKPGVKGGAAAVALPAGYSTEAGKIASKQLTLAGMRLAVVLFQNL